MVNWSVACAGVVQPTAAMIIPRVLGSAAPLDTQPPDPNKRAKTRIVFFDAVDPTTPKGQIPNVLFRSWRFVPHLRALADPSQTGPAEQSIAQSATFSLHLPVARPPAQLPTLRSAGIALSPYRRDPAYDRTEERTRALWIELTEPIGRELSLFARVLERARPAALRPTERAAAAAADPARSGVRTCHHARIERRQRRARCHVQARARVGLRSALPYAASPGTERGRL
jgi:hypothetical protein